MSGEINFDWSNSNSAKLLSVTDNTGRQVSFGQSNNSLQNATTAAGGQWQYEYAGGKLSNVINAANNIVLRAKYDQSGRATEVGDAVGLNRLAYETNANNISTRTIFTDSLGYARLFQHNSRGILTNVSDAQGTLLSMQYDAGSQLTQITDAKGATTTFEYDAQKRLTRQTAADGSEKVFEYAANGKLKATIENGERTDIVYDEANLTENRRRGNGKNVKSIFNRRGQEIRFQVENGLTLDFEYDEKGRKTADVYSDIGRFEKTFDAAGRKTSEKMPSGFTKSFEYDANNRIVRESNSRGGSRRLERDASGSITKVSNANGDSVQIIRDEAGRIAQLKNSRGQSRRYIYNSRGALTRFIGADGRDIMFQYNSRGEMQSIFNDQTAGLTYQKNQSGNLAKIQQNTSYKNLWQAQKINYSSAFVNSTVDTSCPFGDGFYTGGDGGIEWGNWDNYFAKSVEGENCYDPFADMFGGAGGGGGGLGGESCYQCRLSEANTCQSNFENSIWASIGLQALALGACCLATAGLGTVVCGLFTFAAGQAYNQGARTTRADCLANVARRCPCN